LFSFQLQKFELKQKKKKKQKKNNVAVNKIKKKYKLFEKRRKEEKNESENRWKGPDIKCMTTFPLVSAMGQRVYRSLCNRSQALDQSRIEAITRRNETFCSTKVRIRISKKIPKWNKWKTKNIETIAFRTDFSKNGGIGCHQYSFNRRQRLEKLRRFETRLNWRSRLLALNCDKNLSIDLKRITHCPICCLKLEDNHSCDIDCRQNAVEPKVEVKLEADVKPILRGKLWFSLYFEISSNTQFNQMLG
jgi:hypothetical protein